MSPPLSSRPPAGVPQPGGNIKYALVALLLLAAAGGLYVWRNNVNRDAAQVALPPVPTAAQSQATANSKLDDIPPPPPVEETPEAGRVGPRVATATAATGGACESKCTGTSPPELAAALRVRAGQARRCYNSALASDSTLRGHVSVSVRIGPGGNVCSAVVASNDMGSPVVASCAANIFRTASYPAPHGGCVDANVPMSFVPMGQ
jgi:outer membrane biosynthesis protein TonB